MKDCKKSNHLKNIVISKGFFFSSKIEKIRVTGSLKVGEPVLNERSDEASGEDLDLWICGLSEEGRWTRILWQDHL